MIISLEEPTSPSRVLFCIQLESLCMMIIQSFFALVVDKIPGAHLLAQTRCWSLACRIRVGRFLLLVQLVLRLLAHYWAPWIMIRYSTWLCAGFLFINRRAVESISCCSWVQPRTAALWPLLRKWPHVCLPIPPSETPIRCGVISTNEAAAELMEPVPPITRMWAELNTITTTRSSQAEQDDASWVDQTSATMKI